MNLKLTFLAFLLGCIMPLFHGFAAEPSSHMVNLNPKKITERNSIVYRCLTPSPGEALLFGNGPMGGSVYTPDDSLNIQIGRSDIWNEKNNMGAIAAVRVRGNKGLFSRASAVRQECNLDEATLKISLQTKTGKDVYKRQTGSRFNFSPVVSRGRSVTSAPSWSRTISGSKTDRCV